MLQVGDQAICLFLREKNKAKQHWFALSPHLLYLQCTTCTLVFLSALSLTLSLSHFVLFVCAVHA